LPLKEPSYRLGAKVVSSGYITKQEKTMKKRTRKGTLRVDTLRWNEYIEM